MAPTPAKRKKKKTPVIGLALGSGSARGWSHLGVLRALEAEGVKPDIIAGCSMGSLVGAAAASGYLAPLTDWALSLKLPEVVSLVDFSWRGGFVKGDKLIQFFSKNFIDRDIESLKVGFGSVATDMVSGKEIWLTKGSVEDAVRASISLPGILTPLVRDDRALIDGGLVNPVPITLCRAMGADIVIAVDLCSDMVQGAAWHSELEEMFNPKPAEPNWTDKFFSHLKRNGNGDEKPEIVAPSMLTVLNATLNIMQDRIARSRMAGDPPDVLIVPRVRKIGLMDFHRAAEALQEGEEAVARALPTLRYVLGL